MDKGTGLLYCDWCIDAKRENAFSNTKDGGGLRQVQKVKEHQTWHDKLGMDGTKPTAVSQSKPITQTLPEWSLTHNADLQKALTSCFESAYW